MFPSAPDPQDGAGLWFDQFSSWCGGNVVQLFWLPSGEGTSSAQYHLTRPAAPLCPLQAKLTAMLCTVGLPPVVPPGTKTLTNRYVGSSQHSNHSTPLLQTYLGTHPFSQSVLRTAISSVPPNTCFGLITWAFSDSFFEPSTSPNHQWFETLHVGTHSHRSSFRSVQMRHFLSSFGVNSTDKLFWCGTMELPLVS